MDLSNFAGLTILAPGDALEMDGGSFKSRNITSIDHLLEVGAVTHRHDAHPPLGNPTVPPTVAVYATGGQIGPDELVFFGYTVVDTYGGETLISPLGSGLTAGSGDDPDTAPTVEAVYASGGTLAVGTYYYAVTLTDGTGGETVIGPYDFAVREPGHASGAMLVSGLYDVMAAGSATGWRLYRSFNGGSWGLITSGDTDTYLDDGTDCVDLTIIPPATNSTGGAAWMLVTVPGQASGVSTVRLYGSLTEDFVSPALITEYPGAPGASAVAVPTLTFGEGSPPPVSLSKPGCHKIDALTEIINLGAAGLAAGLGGGSGGSGGGSGSVINNFYTTGTEYIQDRYAAVRTLSGPSIIDFSTALYWDDNTGVVFDKRIGGTELDDDEGLGVLVPNAPGVKEFAYNFGGKICEFGKAVLKIDPTADPAGMGTVEVGFESDFGYKMVVREGTSGFRGGELLDPDDAVIDSGAFGGASPTAVFWLVAWIDEDISGPYFRAQRWSTDPSLPGSYDFQYTFYYDTYEHFERFNGWTPWFRVNPDDETAVVYDDAGMLDSWPAQPAAYVRVPNPLGGFTTRLLLAVDGSSDFIEDPIDKIDGSALGAGSYASSLDYWKDNDGHVHLQKFLDLAGTSAVDDTIATLPSGYRPIAAAHYPVIIEDTGGSADDAVGTVKINTTGTIVLRSVGGSAFSSARIYLDGITFLP